MRGLIKRDTDSRRFRVTITETLKLPVEVEADNRYEAERIVSDGWRNSGYILGADHFVDVAFDTVPADAKESTEQMVKTGKSG